MQHISILTKRWIGFFLLFFCVGYVVSLLIFTAYQATQISYLILGGMIFTPLWALTVSYLYFKSARNDWNARIETAFGWIVLMILISAALVSPIYGYHWSTILNWDVVNGNWMNAAAIFVGAIVAAKK